MKFADIRHTLFTVHMWVGLILGILCAVLGLSGSLLVYDDVLNKLLDPPPFATTQGAPLPLAMVADAAREAAGDKGVTAGQLQITFPKKPAEAVSVRVGQISPMGTMGLQNRTSGEERRRARRRGAEGGGRAPIGLQVFIDPVSGQVLETRRAIGSSIIRFAHQLHGNFLLGREGRSIVVGWLGVAMLLLGATGLVLWWPRRGQWKYAFFVRATATGLRFHRELHAATGIWIFLIFMVVSYSGLVLAWPQLLGPGGPGPRAMPHVTPGTSASIGPDRALALAKAAMPGTEPDSITLPTRPDQPITVGFMVHDAVRASVLVDPWHDRVIGVRDNSGSILAWMRPLHQGAGLGVVWRFLVFLSGLVPSLFIVTGLIMWLKKRRRHVPMTARLEEIPEKELEEEPA
ncbi:MAG: hypothetical protein BGN85_06425 [Alphaproteobacteria bacterium 64-11]|nr:PepSY domain-containing protein [Alphaproteobacteria bacterium]OJU07944.1 MAG: hypothetical protein BGN85_06425 [Alphaproteobacteria bacterium 64-11]